MPYRRIESLPDRVRNHLPVGAQKIYLEAFDHTYEQYSSPSKRRDARLSRGDGEPSRLERREKEVRER